MSSTDSFDRNETNLLQRLTDLAPDAKSEPPDACVVSPQRLREQVRDGLERLLNSTSMGASVDWSALPHARDSVLNYGLPPFNGATTTSVDPVRLQDCVRQVLLNFEPRIVPGSLRVETL